jgi:hypothetical protein
VVNLVNEYLRLTAPDRRKVMRLLDKFFLGQADTLPTWDPWSKDDMQACYLQLQTISQRVSNDFRRWASGLFKAGRNYRFAVGLLKDELQEREWTGITSVWR